MLRDYKIGFDIGGLLLFVLIMTPNFIWFFVQAPDDVLRVESTTPMIDAIASVCQILMIVALCVIINTRGNKTKLSNKLIISCLICCLVYFIAWILYYRGFVNVGILLSLTIFPCLAFLLYEIDRKNSIAVVPTVIFTICHVVSTTINSVL